MSEEAQNIDIEITEEKIEKAALPENRRVEEEVQYRWLYRAVALGYDGS